MRRTQTSCAALASVTRVLILAGAAATAVAQPLCVGPSYGVPGFGLQPPNWWDPSPPQPTFNKRVDDPRWAGSTRIDYNAGQAEFRILEGLDAPPHLYLSWKMNLTDSVENHVFLAWKRPAGTVMVDILVPGGSSVSAVAPGAAQMFLVDAAGVKGAEITGASLPAFLNDFTKMWRSAPWWAVQVRLPKSEIVPEADGTYKIWFQVAAGAPTGGAFAAPYSWPRNKFITSYPNLPPVSDWVGFKPVTNIFAPAAGCLASTISLLSTNIGTTNADPSEITRNFNNTLFAKPINNMATDVNPGQLRARFRLNNWGSTAGSFGDVPGGTSVANSVALPANGVMPPPTPISFTWNPGSAAGMSTYQCMLVELSGSGLFEFANNAVYRNMHFAGASVFERTAEISIKGLTPIAADGRDVYLWIEARNMPASGASMPTQIRTINPPTGPRVIELPGGPGGFVASRGRFTQPGLPTEGQPVQFAKASDLTGLLAAGRITTEILEEVIPTYRVHVFHDSGQSWTVNGSQKAILTPQTTFGVYLTHSGPLHGWAHELIPQGFTLEKLADNFYRIRKVQNEGVIKLVTRITAHETAPGSGGFLWPWWLWLLLLLLILFLIWFFFLRRRTA